MFSRRLPKNTVMRTAGDTFNQFRNLSLGFRRFAPTSPALVPAVKKSVHGTSHRDFVASLRHPQPPAAGCADKKKKAPSSELAALFSFYLR
jgi:hypothetical protein